MKISTIIKQPMNFPMPADKRGGFRNGHESLLRSWHVVAKIKEWLKMDVPPAAILELIEYLYEAQDTPFKID